MEQPNDDIIFFFVELSTWSYLISDESLTVLFHNVLECQMQYISPSTFNFVQAENTSLLYLDNNVNYHNVLEKTQCRETFGNYDA